MKKTNKLIALIVAVLMMVSATTAFAGTYVSDPVSPNIKAPGDGEAETEPEPTAAPEGELPAEEPGLAPEEAPIPEEGAAPEEIEAPAATEAVVQTEDEDGSVNIRAAASMDAEIIGKLTGGMSVAVLDVEGDWSHIRADGIVGYVYSKYLNLPEPEAEETEVASEPEQAVVITANRDPADLQPGDVLSLSAELIGFEGVDYSLSWQVRRDGGDWEDISGANGTTLSIEITEAHNGCSWRLQATANG